MKNIFVFILLLVLTMVSGNKVRSTTLIPIDKKDNQDEEELVLIGYIKGPQTRSMHENYITVYKHNSSIRVVSNDEIGIIRIWIYDNSNFLVYDSSYEVYENIEYKIDLFSYNKGKYQIKILTSNGSILVGFFVLDNLGN